MSVLALPNKTIRTWERVDQLEEHPSVRRLMNRLNQRDGVSIAAVEASLRQGANAQLFALKTIDILERETAKAVVTIFAVDEPSKIAGVSAIAAERGANKEMLRRFRCAAYEFIVRTGARIIFALTAEDNFEDRQVLEDLGFRRVSYAVNAQSGAASISGGLVCAESLDAFRAILGWVDVVSRDQRSGKRPLIFVNDRRPPALVDASAANAGPLAEAKRRSTRLSGGVNVLTGDVHAAAEFETEKKNVNR